MAKSSFINKKFFGIALLFVVLVAGGVGLYYLLKPKADTKLAFKQTYEVTQSEDYEYVKARNNKICDVLSSLSVEDESYGLTKFQFDSFESINSSLDLQNENILNHIMFVEEKDNNLIELQQDMTKSFEALKASIKECKTYVDTYLTNKMINEYTTAQLYLRIYNYKSLYINYMINLTDFYDCVGKVFDGYLYSTIAVNPLSRANVLVTTSLAKKITNYVADYKDEYDGYDFVSAISTLSSFSNRAKDTSVSEYVNNKAEYDSFANTLRKVNLDSCLDAVAKGSYDSYIDSLDGEERTNAVALRTYFLG